MDLQPVLKSSRRRGNTIVLVTAILVLLVIIATAFIGRTRAVRDVSAAQQASAGRDGRGESIGVDVANEIASSLFARPVAGSVNPATGGFIANDPFARIDNGASPPISVASSSWPRLAAPFNASRYSIDRDVLTLTPPGCDPIVPNPVPGDGLPDFGYNIAPFETKPWTNWPDQFGGPSIWPFGPGAPQGATVTAGNAPIGDGNPYGNPGMGDTRWLRSTEPERVAIDQNADGTADYFNFTHWSHLSWLPSAHNGWRVVADISNIETGVIDNMNENDASRPLAVAVPYEQWLPGVVPNQPANAADFINRRNLWFAAPNSGGGFYGTAYANPALALPNLIDLRVLGPSTDEFRAGSDRNAVARTFTDTDGDGLTDSFWFLAPTPVDRGVRTLVGVSVIDNSALLNANVATKFSFDTTAGHTPSDLALVTSAAEFLGNGSTVGFLDGPINQPAQAPTAIPASATLPSPLPTYWTGNPVIELTFQGGVPRFDRSRFGDRDQDNDGKTDTPPLGFLQAIGMRAANGGIEQGSPALGFVLADPALPADPTTQAPLVRGTFESAIERLSYFKVAGLDSDQPLFGVTPFDAADEFELRAFHGNNSPLSLSRFEQALSLYSPSLQGTGANDFQILRSSPTREESSEELDQLSARQLLVDNRRKLTMFNGARNETAPPWLWPTPFYEETRNYMNPRGTVAFDAAFQAANEAEFERQKLKIDLRKPMFVDAAGDPALKPNPYASFLWRRDLMRLFERSLTIVTKDPTDPNCETDIYQSIYGTRPADYNRTLSMIASYAANIDCASDEAVPVLEDLPSPLADIVRPDDDPLVPTPPTSPTQNFPGFSRAVQDPIQQSRFYTGMEKQPFITEVFFGVVYMRSKFNENDTAWLGSDPTGEVIPPEGQDDGEKFVDGNSRAAPVIAVELANPYDTPIDLRDFRLSFFGKTFNFATAALDLAANPAGNRIYGSAPALPAATLGRPSTVVVYFSPVVLDDSKLNNGANDPQDPNAPGEAGFLSFPLEARFLDFLDIERGEVSAAGGSVSNNDLDGDGVIEWVGPHHTTDFDGDDAEDPLDRTLVFAARGLGGDWGENLGTPGTQAFGGRFRNASKSVELLRVIGAPPSPDDPGSIQTTVVVDRFENEETGPEVDFTDAVNRLFTDQAYIPPPKSYNYNPSDPGRRWVAGIRLGTNDAFMVWTRASRVWAFDVDTWDQVGVAADDRVISATELSPRYVFSVASKPAFPREDGPIEGVNEAGGSADYEGEWFQAATDPDDEPGATNGARWPRFEFRDVFNRIVEGKPAFFTNCLVTPRTVGPSGRITAVYESGGNALPFVGDGVAQRGTVSIDGTQYDWQTGAKGLLQAPNDAGLSEWSEFARLPVMRIPFQMTQRDQDFEQIGEILDVFLWGHVYENWSTPTCVRTFSEIMLDDDPDSEFYPGEGIFINRLHTRLPGETSDDDPGSIVIGSRFNPTASSLPLPTIPGFEAWRPALPAGVAFLDGLTIDGPGRNTFDRNVNGTLDPADATLPAAQQSYTDAALSEQRQFRLAHGFLGKKTSGLVNLNTALPETMQAMPMMTRLARAGNLTPYSHAVDSIRNYRDRANANAPAPNLPGPFYRPEYDDRGYFLPHLASGPLAAAFPSDQELLFPGMRGERGFASIGELNILARTPPGGPLQGTRNSWSMRWLGLDPYRDFPAGSFQGYNTGYSWSTDRTNPRPRQLPADITYSIGQTVAVPVKPHDEPLGDAEDMNLLFKGISNLVTTRSDVFTVYLRVRQVRPDPVTGVYDGSDFDNIVDDSRYVMCVDRSEVNRPGDQPRIIYFQKVPE